MEKTSLFQSSLTEERRGHYRGCVYFSARKFEQPGTYTFCYNEDFDDYQNVELFSIPHLNREESSFVSSPDEYLPEHPNYKYPYLKHAFGLGGRTPEDMKGNTVASGLRRRNPSRTTKEEHEDDRENHQKNNKNTLTKPVFTLRYNGPSLKQDPKNAQKELAMFQRYVPMEIINHERGTERAWWV